MLLSLRFVLFIALPLHPVVHDFSSGELLNKDTSAKVKINK